jgi:PAS domain S-box-containing protein
LIHSLAVASEICDPSIIEDPVKVGGMLETIGEAAGFDAALLWNVSERGEMASEPTLLGSWQASVESSEGWLLERFRTESGGDWKGWFDLLGKRRVVATRSGESVELEAVEREVDWVIVSIAREEKIEGVLAIRPTGELLPWAPMQAEWAIALANLMSASFSTSRAQRALQESQDLLRSVFDSMSSGVMVTDRKGKVLMANPAAVENLGVSGTELTGCALSEVVTNGDALMQDTPPGERRTASITLDDGQSRIIGFTSARLFRRGHRVTVFRDVTPIRKMEQRRRRAEQLAQVGEMAARLTHEIKNPLASILAGLEVLESRTRLSFSQNAVLQSIIEEANALSCAVTDLLRAARPSLMSPRLLRLGRTVYDAVEPVLDFASKRNIEVKVTPPEHDSKVAVDPGEFGRVLRNLIVNAVEATPAGGNVEISWGPVGAKEKAKRFPTLRTDVYRITVGDTGVGIEPQKIERIFEPFYTTKESGTGLGLAVSLDIIERHGGVMQVDSTLGKGTAFHVYLVAGLRPPCWEQRTECGAHCAACEVRETPAGYCCWAATGESVWAEAHAWPEMCHRCRYFRKYNLQAHFQYRTRGQAIA